MVNPRRVAILGCGYVGSALAERLIAIGHDVVGTTTTPDRLDAIRRLGARAMRVDVANGDDIVNVLADRDVVYLTIAPKRRDIDYRDVYLTAARNLVDAVRRTGVRRIIYTSSTRVYGQSDGSRVDESSRTEPSDDAGRALVEAEDVLLQAAPGGEDGRCVTVLRLGGIYGPQRELQRRVAAVAGSEQTNGDVYVNLIHRDDIVAALTTLLNTPYHGVLNLCDDRPELRRDLYDRIAAEAGLPAIRWTATEQGTPAGKRVSNALIKATLGLKLIHPTH